MTKTCIGPDDPEFDEFLDRLTARVQHPAYWSQTRQNKTSNASGWTYTYLTQYPEPKTKKKEEKAPPASPIMKHFAYDHLPEPLQQVSKRIHDLANYFDTTLPDGPEKSAGLRKLLESKDAFVRAAL